MNVESSGRFSKIFHTLMIWNYNKHSHNRRFFDTISRAIIYWKWKILKNFSHFNDLKLPIKILIISDSSIQFHNLLFNKRGNFWEILKKFFTF